MGGATYIDGVMMHLGKPYAVGLLWFTVQEDRQKELLQQRLKKTKADYHCLRTHISQQQGFGWLNKGHRRGMAVAAAIVADQIVGEWHGVFEADNGWWYVQVRSDTITPQGDRFFASEEEAYRHFQTEMKNHTWPYAYAPSKWNLTDTTIRHMELKNLLDGLATTTLVADNISAIFGGRGKRNLIVGGLVAAMVSMGGFAAYSITKQPEQIILPPAKMMPVKPLPKLEAPKPDRGEIIAPAQLIASCGKALSLLYTTLPGWNVTEFTCNATRASLAWQQESGSLTRARAAGDTHWPKNVAINYTNRVLTVSLSLDQLPKSEQSDLYTQEQALVFLEEQIQPIGMAQIKPVTPPMVRTPPRPVTGPKPLIPPSPPLAPQPYLDVTITTGLSPQHAAAFATGKGFEIVQMTWNIPKALWVYQAKLLHKRAVAPTPVKPKPQVKK
jgi:hypothetical protein